MYSCWQHTNERIIVINYPANGCFWNYLNGKKIYSFGNVSNVQKEIQTYNPRGGSVILQFDDEPFQILAIRYAYKKNVPYFTFAGRPNPCFSATIKKTKQIIKSNDPVYLSSYAVDIFKIGVFCILAILHFGLLSNFIQKKKLLTCFFTPFWLRCYGALYLYIRRR